MHLALGAAPCVRIWHDRDLNDVNATPPSPPLFLYQFVSLFYVSIGTTFGGVMYSIDQTPAFFQVLSLSLSLG